MLTNRWLGKIERIDDALWGQLGTGHATHDWAQFQT
jgi:hypothetical protein